jgi:hypothetical protein
MSEQPVLHRACALLKELERELQGKPGAEGVLELVVKARELAKCQDPPEGRPSPEEELRLRERGVII